jgi:hypothetical protein
MQNSVIPTGSKNQVALVIAVSPAAGRPGHFDALFDGRVIVAVNEDALLDGARKLIRLGSSSDAVLVRKHVGSETECLRSKLGVADGLTVKDRDHGRPTFERWQSMPPSSPVEPPMRQTPTARIHGHDDGPRNGHTAQARPSDLTITAISKGQLVPSRRIVRPAAIPSSSDRIRLRRAIGRCPRTSSP